MDEEDILLDDPVQPSAPVATSDDDDALVSSWLKKKFAPKQPEQPKPTPSTPVSPARKRLEGLQNIPMVTPRMGLPSEIRNREISDIVKKKGNEQKNYLNNLATVPGVGRMTEDREDPSWESSQAQLKTQAKIDLEDFKRTGSAGSLIKGGLRALASTNPLTAGLARTTVESANAASFGFLGEADAKGAGTAVTDVGKQAVNAITHDFTRQTAPESFDVKPREPLLSDIGNISTGDRTADMATSIAGGAIGALATLNPITKGLQAAGVAERALLPAAAAIQSAASNTVQGKFDSEALLDIASSALSGYAQTRVNAVGLDIATKEIGRAHV